MKVSSSVGSNMRKRSEWISWRFANLTRAYSGWVGEGGYTLISKWRGGWSCLLGSKICGLAPLLFCRGTFSKPKNGVRFLLLNWFLVPLRGWNEWRHSLHKTEIQRNFVDFDQVSYTELIIKLMNSQNFSVNSHLLKFVSLCNDLRNNLLSNHADDTWLTVVIIALHYHCYKL